MDLNQILSLSLYAMAVGLVFYGAPTLEAGMSLTLSSYWVAVFSLSTRVFTSTYCIVFCPFRLSSLGKPALF